MAPSAPLLEHVNIPDGAPSCRVAMALKSFPERPGHHGGFPGETGLVFYNWRGSIRSTQEREFAEPTCESQRSAGTCQELELGCVKGEGGVEGGGSQCERCRSCSQAGVSGGSVGGSARGHWRRRRQCRLRVAGAGSSSAAGALQGSAWQSCSPSR